RRVLSTALRVRYLPFLSPFQNRSMARWNWQWKVGGLDAYAKAATSHAAFFCLEKDDSDVDIASAD
ncbi:hypothetical protein, partial [Massilia sp. TWR1-2-2]|uniref:hypothetical protein n=1 Tax=Massilia sp. TWR1-2-2 TaxID=2804584 RepID=UPI003CECAF10